MLIYVKKNLLGILIACAVISFIYEALLDKPQDLTITTIFGFLIFIVAGRERDSDKIRLNNKLQKRGLTSDDISNITFVKNWEETLKRGVWHYCFYNGGVITGMALVIPISLIQYKLGDRFFEYRDFNKMATFILQCMIIGYAVGTILYRIRWSINQKKFTRLTDPIQ